MNFTQYSGADWIHASAKISAISPFGEKVADVLGLVYQGIYHISDHVLRDRSIWSENKRIQLVIHGNLSTWDFNRLTLLFMACYEQGISVEISGAILGSFRLTFWDSKPDFDVHKLAVDLSGFMANPYKLPPLMATRSYLNLLRLKSERWRQPRNASDADLISVAVSCPCLEFKKIAEMVILAHHNAVRVEVGGLSYRSLEVTFSQRQREGSMFERHPDWSQAIELYKFGGKSAEVVV